MKMEQPLILMIEPSLLNMLSEISFSFELFFCISFDHDDTAQSTFLALILLTIINQKTQEILP